jgi:predicted MFS family arabinose efflux permease
VDAASWRAIFLVNLPLVAATLALVLVAVPARRSAHARVRIDVVGAVLCTLGLAGPVFALIEQPRRGWSDPLIITTFVGGIALLVLFVAWEARTEQPMLPLRLFQRRNFAAANVETVAVYGGLGTTGFFLAVFVQQLSGYSALEAGLTFLPTTAVLFVLSRRVGAWSMRIGPRLFMGVGPLVAAVGLLGLARLSPGFSYLREALPPVLVFAVGLALTVAPLTATVLADAGPGDAGIASGINNAVARVAGLLATAVIGLAVAGPSNELDASGYRLAMGITAALMACGGIIGLVGIRNR